MLLSWGDDASFLQCAGQVVLVKETGFIRVPTIYYDILDDLIRNRVDKESVKDCFDDLEDSKTIQDLIEKLIDIGVIVEHSNSLHRDSIDHIGQLTIMITNKCNLSCIHCCQDADSLLCNKQEMSYSDICCNIIDKLEKMKVDEIVISGGEPLTRDDFLDISRYIKSKFHGKLSLLTNALLISEKNVDQIIEYYDHIGISIDGVDEELTNKIRGNNVFKKVLRSIELLHQHGFHNIDLSAILPSSLDVRNKFISLCKEINVNPMPRKLIHMGRADDNGNIIDKVFKEYILLHNYDSIDQSDVHSIGGLSHCGACSSHLTIDAYGDIYPCNLLQYEKYCLGNVNTDENVLTTYQSCNNYSKVKKLRKMDTDFCGKCELKNICWSCIADYERISSDKVKFEEYCNRRKKSLYKYYFGDAYEY